MPNRVHHHPSLIYSPGTQVVLLANVTGAGGRILQTRGAVGVVLRSPKGLEHTYCIRFPDGTETGLQPAEIISLARHKEGLFGDSEVTSSRTNLFDW